MTDAEFRQWLARDNEERCILVELDYIAETLDVSPTPESATLYLSDREFFDTVTNRAYVDCVKAAPAYTRSLSGEWLGIYTSAISTLELDNADGELDFLLRLAIDGSEIRFYYGGRKWPVADFKHIYTALMVRAAAPTIDRISVTLKDTGLLLNQSIGGSPISIGPNAGRPKAITCGYIHNLDTWFIDEPIAGQLVYAYTDAIGSPVAAVAIEVRDRGVSVSFTDNSDGTFTLTAAPDGLITADVLSEPMGTDNVKVSDAMEFVAGQLGGLSARGLYSGPGPTYVVGDDDDCRLGVAIREPRNITDEIGDIAYCGNAFWAVKRTGEFTFGRLRPNDIEQFITGSPALMDAVDIVEDDIDQNSFKLDHGTPLYGSYRAYTCHNWTQQSDLASSLSPDEQAIYKREGIYLEQTPSLGTDYVDSPESYHLTLTQSPVIATLLSEEFGTNDTVSLQRWMDVRLAMTLPWIETISITVGIDFYPLELGDVVRLTMPRFGCDEGGLFQVIGIVLRLTDAKVELRLCRRTVIQPVPTEWTRLDIATVEPRIIKPQRKLYVTPVKAKSLSRVSTWTVPKTCIVNAQSGICGFMVGGDIHIVTHTLASTIGTTSGSYSVDAYSLAGASLGNVTSGTFAVANTSGTTHNLYSGANNYLAFERSNGLGDSGSPTVSAWVYAGTRIALNVNANSSWYYAARQQPVYNNGAIYVSGGGGLHNAILAKWAAAPGGQPSGTTCDAFYDLGSATSGDQYTVSPNAPTQGGYIWMSGPDPLNVGQNALWQFAENLTVVRLWHQATRPGNLIAGSGFVVIDDPYLVCLAAGAAYCYRLNRDGTWTLINSVSSVTAGPMLVSLGDGYILCANGVLRVS